MVERNRPGPKAQFVQGVQLRALLTSDQWATMIRFRSVMESEGITKTGDADVIRYILDVVGLKDRPSE